MTKRTRNPSILRSSGSSSRGRLVAVSALFLSSTIVAQEKPTTGGTLDAVNVTAERRTENIKDVPSSISTIAGEKLDVLNSSGEDIRFLSGRVPSLNIESSFGRAFPRFYIRGYGNTDFHLNASQPVSLIYDDIVQENPILKGFPIFDTEQIEVLAGPQGTLFGRNTPAGVVKIDSVKPTQKFEGYINTSAARFRTTNVEGAINLPINEDLAARFSIQAQHRNDFVSNTVPSSPSSKLEGYDDTAGRFQLLYQPAGGNFSALANVHARTLDGTARLFRANIIKPGTNDFSGYFDPRQVSFNGTNDQTLDTNGASLKLRWEFGSVALSSIFGYEHVTAFSRGDVDGGYGASFAPPSGPGFIPFPSETSDALHGHNQITQEFRLESLGPGPLKWQTGVYYFHENYGIESIDYTATPNQSVSADQGNNAAAIFGSAGYQLTDAFNLRAGVRYTKDRKFLSTSTANTAIVTSAGLARGTSDSKVNYDVSGTYAVTKDVNLYARVATGFRGSSIFPASAFGPLTSAAPETNTSFEVGVKGDLFDKRARVSFSAFDYNVKNQQLSAVGGATNSTILLSAKKSIGRGFEGNIDAYLTERLLVTLNGSYNYTKIKDPNLRVAVCAQCTPTDPLTVLTPAQAPPFGATVATIDGNPLPQAPKYIGNVTARYGFPFANGGEAFVYTDWSYRSKVNFFLYESPEFTGKALLLGGLRAGYNWDGGKYEVAVFGRNITNQVKIVGGIDFNNLTGFINEPRIWGAQFKAQF